MSTQIEHDFLNDCHHYRTIPIVKKYFVDMITPIQMYQALEKDAVYLLESNDEQSPWSNYSFIGLSPFMTIEADHEKLYVKNNENKNLFESSNLQDSFRFVKDFLQVKEIELDLPFKGGAVGYIGYDAIVSMENIPKHKYNDLNLKTHHLLFCKTIIVYSHVTKEISFIHYVQLTGEETVDEKIHLFNQSHRIIAQLFNQICTFPFQYENVSTPVELDLDFSNITSSYKKEAFLHHVEKIKEYILAGDVFQTVLSQRFELPLTISAFQLYRVLRSVNPSPYLFYIKLKDFEIVGSSPEKLLQVQDGHLEIHPIAGTRRRGRTREEDITLGEELMRDQKEQAEHYMLVDLARNDIGMVSKYGSVQVPMMKQLHYFSHVMHLVSKVTGTIRDDFESIDALLASFPAGTVSGAPKIRAMQIIGELEPVARNVYAGTIAYIGFDGNIDSCIAIRSAVVKNKKAYIQAGAGIVADSIPEMEYMETIHKASSVIRAALIAEKMFSREENVSC